MLARENPEDNEKGEKEGGGRGVCVCETALVRSAPRATADRLFRALHGCSRVQPKDHKKIKASEFRPVEKELVFDIDMTDYDEIRTCCSGAAICRKCWPFMNVAIRIVDTALRGTNFPLFLSSRVTSWEDGVVGAGPVCIKGPTAHTCSAQTHPLVVVTNGNPMLTCPSPFTLRVPADDCCPCLYPCLCPCLCPCIAVFPIYAEDFGFQHLLWVYSGRRGVHCWVADKRARKLSQDGRSAVAEYLSILKGGEHVARKVNLTTPLYPALARALEIAKPYFKRMILSPNSQDILATKEHQKQLLAVIGDQQIEAQLLESWDGDGQSAAGADSSRSPVPGGDCGTIAGASARVPRVPGPRSSSLSRAPRAPSRLANPGRPDV